MLVFNGRYVGVQTAKDGDRGTIVFAEALNKCSSIMCGAPHFFSPLLIGGLGATSASSGLMLEIDDFLSQPSLLLYSSTGNHDSYPGLLAVASRFAVNST